MTLSITLPYVPTPSEAWELALTLYYASEAPMRIPELEAIIATDAYYSLCYADNVIGGSFELGEPAIAIHPETAYKYAKNIIQRVWEDGEDAIATNADYAYNYAMYIKQGRFEKGEAIIATDAQRSYDYARWILKDRFEIAEPIIAQNKSIKYFYNQYLKQLGIYSEEENLNIIAAEYNVSIDLVKEIAKLFDDSMRA